ncbi:MAG: hypothetical protein J6S21_06105, partial [Victivallales bacterium]|nr:hypothetical protein [Victivallales bacterium]
YDALIANTKNSDDKVQFGADIMRYSVTSGTDDREIRFTGAESKADLEEGSATLQKLLKTDISLPSGDDWEEISDDAENAPSFVADTMPEKLGFDNGEELFLDDDGNDLTAQVMSNLIDFSDEDDYATHNAEIGGGKVKMNTAIDADTVINTPENWYFGNEKVPYISGVGLELCEPAGGVTNSTVSYNILFVGNRTVDVWSIPSAAAAPNLKLKMRALLGNIFNEDFPDNVHCRVVVRGRLAIYYKVQTRNALDMDQIVTYFADQTYTGENTSPTSLARHITAYTSLRTKLGLGGIGGNVLGTGLYNESSENTLL